MVSRIPIKSFQFIPTSLYQNNFIKIDFARLNEQIIRGSHKLPVDCSVSSKIYDMNNPITVIGMCLCQHYTIFSDCNISTSWNRILRNDDVLILFYNPLIPGWVYGHTYVHKICVPLNSITLSNGAFWMSFHCTTGMHRKPGQANTS